MLSLIKVRIYKNDGFCILHYDDYKRYDVWYSHCLLELRLGRISGFTLTKTL